MNGVDETPNPNLINPLQTYQAAKSTGLSDSDLRVPHIVILTYSNHIFKRVGEMCETRTTRWIQAEHHPYAAAENTKRGSFKGNEFLIMIPPMGASPLACVVEDLIYCGAGKILLICPAWSIDVSIGLSDSYIPLDAWGRDGTSTYYGNQNGYVEADSELTKELLGMLEDIGARINTGSCATCEALYRIDHEMLREYRSKGCRMMDNGEVLTLFSIAKQLEIQAAALLNPYILVEDGWNPEILHGQAYRDTCERNAEIALGVIGRLG